MQLLSNFDSVKAFLADPNRRKQRVAVACPHDEHSLEAVAAALEAGFAEFTLIGRPENPLASEISKKFPDAIKWIEIDDNDEAARIAVRLVRKGHADVLMKGLLNTDNLLRAVLNKQEGILLPGSVLTHITAAQIPGFERLLFFSDAAVIPNPTVEQHSEMVGYISRVCYAFGIERPRIALIHCNEKTSPKFPVTVGYSEIKQRAADGFYGNVVIDGPMDVKTALDSHSAKIKGIESAVNGEADALIFPDIEAGNVFYKSVSLFADSLNAGMLMGASAPVVLPSRSDSSKSKLCSLAMACLYASASSN